MSKYVPYIAKIQKADTIAVFMHINPDADCIGAALAITLFLKKQGKTAHCFSQNIERPVPEKLKFLAGTSLFNPKDRLKKYQLSIAVDTGDAGRIGDELFQLFSRSDTTLVIDHHLEAHAFADSTLRETESASTTQILYKLMKEYDANGIDADIASLLYAGILTDSGGFTFSCTGIETHIVASELMSYGIPASEIARRVMKDVPLSVFRLKNRVLDKAGFYEGNKISVITFHAEDFLATGTNENDTEGIVNQILNVNTVEIAVAISEIGNKKFKVSFRTKHSVSAAACAKTFGGGGHYFAAGCRIYGYYEDVLNRILDVAKEMLSYA